MTDNWGLKDFVLLINHGHVRYRYHRDDWLLRVELIVLTAAIQLPQQHRLHAVEGTRAAGRT